MIKHHKRLVIIPVILVSLALLAACTPSTPQPMGWSGIVTTDSNLFFGSRDGRIVEMNAASGARLWAATLGVQRTGSTGCGTPAPIVAIYGTPAVSGNMVYTGTYVQQGNASQGKIFAFVVGRDEPRWLYPREGFLSGPVVGGMVVYQDKVYFGSSDGFVYALDAVDGHKVAQYQTGDKVWSTPVVENNTVYIGSFDKKLYALDAATLQPTRWQSFLTDGAIAAAPRITGGTIFIGSFDRNLYAIDQNSGSLRWKFPAGNWFWAEPIVYNGTVYAPCLDNRVYVLDAATGAQKVAALVLDSPAASSPTMVGNKVIVAAESGRVYAIDTARNAPSLLADLKQNIDAPLTASGGTIYVHTNADALFSIEVATGAVHEMVFK